MKNIVSFYSGKGTDNRGRTLNEILDWDDVRLEDVHDYIQWLFPLMEMSQFNPNAPVLTSENIENFRSDSCIRDNMRKSFERMLKFYGFTLSSSGEHIIVIQGEDFSWKYADWITIYNHNFLRITRILKSLSLLGFSAEANAFLKVLEEVYQDRYSDRIGEETMEFWRGAVNVE